MVIPRNLSKWIEIGRLGWVTHHGENNPATRNQFIETGLGDCAEGLQRCAARHRAVGVHQAQGLARDEVALQVGGHGEAHGSEAVLRMTVSDAVGSFRGSAYPADLGHSFCSCVVERRVGDSGGGGWMDG